MVFEIDAMLGHALAMISDDDNESVLGDPQLLERGKNLADGVVAVTDFSVVKRLGIFRVGRNSLRQAQQESRTKAEIGCAQARSRE